MMTYILVAILIVSLLLIATERQTNINKAAVSVFACTLGWMLFVGFGADFVQSQHPEVYESIHNSEADSSTAVKLYIARSLFLPYIGRAAEVVLFLLCTANIVTILLYNGCFDFLTLWMRTRNSRLLLWKLTALSFIMSANLDNISTIVIMLSLSNSILRHTKDRLLYGAMVMLAVNFGGVLTVIGDPLGVVLWSREAITATDYSLSMLLPCLLAWILPTLYVGYRMPSTVDVEYYALPYRGNDTRLNIWQRVVMFLVGIGGLWFIPTFHDITKLPPFLGALCVLSLLWIVNELFNRKLLNTNRRMMPDILRQMQYNSNQQILYIVGVMLALGVVTETGAMSWVARQMDTLIGNVWGVGILTAAISCVLDNFASCMTMVSLHDVMGNDPYYGTGGSYWKILSFGAAVGGSILGIGNISGIVMMGIQNMSLAWYVRHITPIALVSGVIAFVVLCIQLA